MMGSAPRSFDERLLGLLARGRGARRVGRARVRAGGLLLLQIVLVMIAVAWHFGVLWYLDSPFGVSVGAGLLWCVVLVVVWVVAPRRLWRARLASGLCGGCGADFRWRAGLVRCDRCGSEMRFGGAGRRVAAVFGGGRVRELPRWGLVPAVASPACAVLVSTFGAGVVVVLSALSFAMLEGFYRVAVVPVFMVLFVQVSPMLLVWNPFRQRLGRGCCGYCGYDVRGVGRGGVCPECGQPVHPETAGLGGGGEA